MADINAAEKAVKKIDALVKSGDIENAILAYESLRENYGSLNKETRKKMYPKLIALHKKISEKATG